MKTAMQEAIKEIAKLWSSPSDTPNYTQIFKVLESKLEPEKEQIIDAYKQGCGYEYEYIDDESTLYKEQAEEYYNQTYNQNK